MLFAFGQMDKLTKVTFKCRTMFLCLIILYFLMFIRWQNNINDTGFDLKSMQGLAWEGCSTWQWTLCTTAGWQPRAAILTRRWHQGAAGTGKLGKQDTCCLSVFAHGSFLFESVINFKIKSGPEKHYSLLVVLTFSDSESNRNECMPTLRTIFSGPDTWT